MTERNQRPMLTIKFNDGTTLEASDAADVKAKLEAKYEGKRVIFGIPVDSGEVQFALDEASEAAAALGVITGWAP